MCRNMYDSMVLVLMLSHLDAARRQCQGQLPNRGHSVITYRASESSIHLKDTSRANTLNMEEGTFQLCSSSSSKTKLMKNYYVYLIKSYTIMRNSINQKSQNKTPTP